MGRFPRCVVQGELKLAGTWGILSDGSVGRRSDILVEMEEVSRIVFRLDLCPQCEKWVPALSDELGTPEVRGASSLLSR